ncbi:hypothetical protein NYD60_26025 [Burkholderia thailandensis]|uniref:hypothetical protein n=1 Tax=Burkholderia thailandensis TaxID=57975 RepID=UPI00217E03A6|nr:hypothetical protein [Burkholderia thailandensis]MCS6503427.1 hypothetical protein [Burkholderia thailandensis]
MAKLILDRSVVVFGFNRTRHEVVMPAAHWPACDGLRQCALRLAARSFDATLRFCVALPHADERFAFRDSGRDLISREAPWRACHALGRQLQAGAADAVRMRAAAAWRRDFARGESRERRRARARRCTSARPWR